MVEVMKTLLNRADKEEILRRLDTIHPSSARRWGKMSAPQMIAHLNDAFRMFMDERAVKPVTLWYPRALLKWGALWAPVPWPHGFPAPPELDQRGGGTAPGKFAEDLAEVRRLIDRVTGEPRDFEWAAAHPHFGPLTPREWMRLGYLHTDHHLRQFGA